MSPQAPELLDIEVAYSPRPGVVERVALRLTAPVTLAEALHASGLLQRHGLAPEGLRVGIWGRLHEPDALLRTRDRVEIYRGLQVDPKEARRQRYKRQRAERPKPTPAGG